MKNTSRYLLTIAVVAPTTLLTANAAAGADPAKPAPAKSAAPASAGPSKAVAAKSVEPPLGPAKVASKPGQWETKTSTKMDDGGRREGTSLVCISPRDLRSPEVLLPTYSQVGMTCANRDIKFNGNVVTWKVSCAGAGNAIEGSATLTFAETTQKGSGTYAQGVAGKTIKMQQTINAKFLGPC
jgi:hypothetical protein